MNSKQFNKEVKRIVEKHEPGELPKRIDDKNSYHIKTMFGELYIRSSPSPKIKSYAIFMRFVEHDKFDKILFDDAIKGYSLFNNFTLKWNIHASNPDYCLDELTERLDSLKWLKENKDNLVFN